MTAAKNAICFVNTNGQWGGGEKWHLSTACYFRDQQVSTLMVTNRDSALYRAATQAGFSPLAMQIGNLSLLNPLKLFKLVKFFKDNGVSTVVLNLPSDAKFAGLAARLAGVRHIVYRRGMPKKPSASALNKWLFNDVITHVVGNSQEIVDKMVQGNEAWFPVAKTSIIYNGVDTRQPFPAPKPLAADKNPLVIGSVGRLVDQKGQLWLVEICQRLKAKGHQVRIDIAGEGEKRTELEAAIEAAGLGEDIRLLGHVSDMAGFMAAIDLLAFTSKYEGSANTLIEALYHGVPVVAFDASSNPEVVVHGQTGLLAKAFDVADMAAKIEDLINNKTLTAQMVQSGQALVKSKFDMHRNLEKLLAIHRQQ